MDVESREREREWTYEYNGMMGGLLLGVAPARALTSVHTDRLAATDEREIPTRCGRGGSAVGGVVVGAVGWVSFG